MYVSILSQKISDSEDISLLHVLVMNLAQKVLTDSSSRLMTIRETVLMPVLFIHSWSVYHLFYHYSLPFYTNWNQGQCLWNKSCRWHYCTLGSDRGNPALLLFRLLHRWLAIPAHEQELISTLVPYLSLWLQREAILKSEKITLR